MYEMTEEYAAYMEGTNEIPEDYNEEATMYETEEDYEAAQAMNETPEENEEQEEMMNETPEDYEEQEAMMNEMPEDYEEQEVMMNEVPEEYEAINWLVNSSETSSSANIPEVFFSYGFRYLHNEMCVDALQFF